MRAARRKVIATGETPPPSPRRRMYYAAPLDYHKLSEYYAGARRPPAASPYLCPAAPATRPHRRPSLCDRAKGAVMSVKRSQPFLGQAERCGARPEMTEMTT
jgi:hypothetical protein